MNIETLKLIERVLADLRAPIYWVESEDSPVGVLVNRGDLRIEFETGEGFHEGTLIVRFSRYTYKGTSVIHQYEEIPRYDYTGIPEWFSELLKEEQ